MNINYLQSFCRELYTLPEALGGFDFLDRERLASLSLVKNPTEREAYMIATVMRRHFSRKKNMEQIMKNEQITEEGFYALKKEITQLKDDLFDSITSKLPFPERKQFALDVDDEITDFEYGNSNSRLYAPEIPLKERELLPEIFELWNVDEKEGTYRVFFTDSQLEKPEVDDFVKNHASLVMRTFEEDGNIYNVPFIEGKKMANLVEDTLHLEASGLRQISQTRCFVPKKDLSPTQKKALNKVKAQSKEKTTDIDI